MTPDPTPAPLEAGPALNRAVAIDVLGWQPDPESPGCWIPPGCRPPSRGVYYTEKPKRYSEEIAAAWLVVEALNKDGAYVAIGAAHHGNWPCVFICEGPAAGAQHREVLLNLWREEAYYHSEKSDPRFATRRPVFVKTKTLPLALSLAALAWKRGLGETT